MSLQTLQIQVWEPSWIDFGPKQLTSHKYPLMSPVYFFLFSDFFFFCFIVLHVLYPQIHVAKHII